MRKNTSFRNGCWGWGLIGGLAVGLAVHAQTPPQTPPRTAPVPAPPSATADAASANRQAEAAFKRADTNQDGKLSRAEAERLPVIAQRFDQLDANHDQFISLEEFNRVGTL